MQSWNEDLSESESQDESELPEGINAYHAYDCAFCGENNEVFVDGSGARTQRFTEDCEVCCRPNLISISIQVDDTVDINVEREYDA